MDHLDHHFDSPGIILLNNHQSPLHTTSLDLVLGPTPLNRRASSPTSVSTAPPRTYTPPLRASLRLSFLATLLAPPPTASGLTSTAARMTSRRRSLPLSPTLRSMPAIPTLTLRVSRLARTDTRPGSVPTTAVARRLSRVTSRRSVATISLNSPTTAAVPNPMSTPTSVCIPFDCDIDVQLLIHLLTRCQSIRNHLPLPCVLESLCHRYRFPGWNDCT